MVSKDQIEFWEFCRDGNYSFVKRELEKGMDPNFIHKGIPPLMAASDFTCRLTTKLLLEHGADPNVAGDMGKTLLMHVSKYETNQVISKIMILELILFGADISAIDNQGVGVMDYALRGHGGKKSILLCLLEQGANINEYFNYKVRWCMISDPTFYELVEKFQAGLTMENKVKWKTIRLKSLFR